MASTTLKIEGLQALGEAMRGLGKDMAQKVSRQAVAAGAKVIKKAAIANVVRSPSIDTGSLKGAIISKKLPASQTTLTAEYIVTVRGRGKPANAKGKKIDRAPHANLVEFGTVNMPAEPFMRPAFDREKAAAARAIADKLRQRIDKVRAAR